LGANAKWAGACAVLAFFVGLNIRGIQVSGWISTAMLVAVLVPVAGLCLVSLLHLRYSPFLPWVPPDRTLGAVFGLGLQLAMWNYAGYEQLSSVTGEMEDPKKTFPRVLFWNTPMNILTYTLPAALALAVLGNWQEWKTGFMVEASRRIGGETLGLAMVLASPGGAPSRCHSPALYTTPLPPALAQDGYLPAWLGKLHPKFRTPARAIAVCLVVACLLSRFRVVDLVN